jgi:hypothetical protein
MSNFGARDVGLHHSLRSSSLKIELFEPKR